MKTATKKRNPAGQQDGIVSRPILFSAPMVLAILAGRKTMTRRVIRPAHVEGLETDTADRFSFMHSPKCGGGCDYACASSGETLAGHIGWTPWGSNPRSWGRLWVRETWQRFGDADVAELRRPRPAADEIVYQASEAVNPFGVTLRPWRPSIFMPRQASRITLTITGIRVERLQDITEDDAKAEGFRPFESCDRPRGDRATVHEFRKLWEKLNGARGFGWDANPWVWVVEFRKV